MSESDRPFELVQLPTGTPNLGPAEARGVTGHPAGTRVEESSVAHLFAGPTAEQKWHGDAEKADVARYRALQAIFADRLIDAKVFRVGETEVHVVVVGKTADGRWVGVKTVAIET